MHFLCLVHLDKDLASALTSSEREALDRENLAYAAWLDDGPAIAMSALEEPATATLIRRRRGELSMTDGPYVETKEHLAGFMFIKARDREEAIEIASKSPVARIGTIEVRAASYIEPK
jgi:hypothetical protein